MRTPGKNRRPSRDDGCCSVSFLKYVLFIFNFLFYLSGMCILAAGLWTIFTKTNYISLLSTHTFLTTTYALVLAGVLVLLVGIIGCCGVLKEHRCSLLWFCFLLLLIFLVESVTGALAFIYSEQIQRELELNLNKTFANKYGLEQYSSISKATENLHREFQCCGAFSYQDWTKSSWYQTVNKDKDELEEPLLVPSFCCKTETPLCGKRDHPSNIHTDGCVLALKDEIREHEIILSAIALGMSVVQLFGMVLSCCLYVKLKDFEEYKSERARNSYY